jgi:hypothetical protein
MSQQVKDEIAVSGTSFLRGGEAWYPRGFNCLGLLAPEWCNDPLSNRARALFSPDTRAAWRSQGANLLRWQISQKGVTDASLDDATRQRYVDFVVSGIGTVRAEGWNCIISCQDQKHGCGPGASTPSPRTTLFWQTIAPHFVGDTGVMFEAFNEPRTNASQQARWRDGGGTNNLGEPRVGHQALLDTIRATGARNVVIVDGGSWAKTLEGTTPLGDPLNNYAYAIHPYDYDKLGGPEAWDRPYATVPTAAPIIATEWNFAIKKAGSAAESLAPTLLSYLQERNIGVLGHAGDTNAMFADLAMMAPTGARPDSPGSGAIFISWMKNLA